MKKVSLVLALAAFSQAGSAADREALRRSLTRDLQSNVRRDMKDYGLRVEDTNEQPTFATSVFSSEKIRSESSARPQKEPISVPKPRPVVEQPVPRCQTPAPVPVQAPVRVQIPKTLPPPPPPAPIHVPAPEPQTTKPKTYFTGSYSEQDDQPKKRITVTKYNTYEQDDDHPVEYVNKNLVKGQQNKITGQCNYVIGNSNQVKATVHLHDLY